VTSRKSKKKIVKRPKSQSHVKGAETRKKRLEEKRKELEKRIKGEIPAEKPIRGRPVTQRSKLTQEEKDNRKREKNRRKLGERPKPETKKEIRQEIENKKTLIRNLNINVPKKKKIQIQKGPSRDKLVELSKTELEVELKKREEELRIALLTRDWVDAMPDEYLHQDGTIALQPSRARHMGEVTDQALAMMRKARRKGTRAFDEMVNDIAGFLDLPLREIYTLWHSP